MTGRLAFSKAGHDKGKLYVIVREEGDALWLADGRRRGLENPKRKNRRHIQPAGQVFTPGELETLCLNPAHGNNLVREAVEHSDTDRRGSFGGRL